MGGGAFNLLKTGCIGPESEKQHKICLVGCAEEFTDLVSRRGGTFWQGCLDCALSLISS
jgi:hypothetical protein